MSTPWTLISDLSAAGEPVAIKVRLIQVFHDSQGDRTEASIPRNLTRAFMADLEEGRIYGQNNLKVVLDSRGYELTTCKFRVFFTDKMENLKLLGKDFPDKQFELKSFDDVLAIQNADHIPTFDVIGLLVRVSEVETLQAKNSGEKMLLNILLQDTEMRTLSCTLCENYVNKLRELFEGQSSVSHLPTL